MTTDQATMLGSKLIQLLSQQQLLYRKLKELAQKQSTLVDGDDPEMLLRVLSGRQRLIDRLAIIDCDLKPIRSDWKRVSGSLPFEQKEQAQELIDNVQQILGEILAQDEKDSKTLYKHQQKVAKEIRTTAAGKQMNQAYGQNSNSVQRRIFDIRSE